MRQLATFLTVLLLAIFLPGCPYDSDDPLGTPQQRLDIDSRVTGYWVLDEPKGGQKQMLLSILPFNDFEYFIEMTRNEAGTPSQYRAFPVKIGDQKYGNVNQIDSSFRPTKYMFVRSAGIADGQLSILLVGDKRFLPRWRPTAPVSWPFSGRTCPILRSTMTTARGYSDARRLEKSNGDA